MFPDATIMMRFAFVSLLMPLLVAAKIPSDGLVLDLDASRGVTLEDGDRVSSWSNQAPGTAARDFVKQDKGREQAGSGRPTFRKAVEQLGDKPALVFRRQELVCMDEVAFDSLTTGAGNTWIAVIAVHDQKAGLKDVNSFFGNLRNGPKYEGLWGCVNDDNSVWFGARNGVTIGRFDANNPKVVGPVLEKNRFQVVAGRMADGTGEVLLELFVDRFPAVAKGRFPVRREANPSRMAIGQERDAVEHPGYESFDGEIARFLIWERPLGDDQLSDVIVTLQKSYGLEP